MPNIVTYTIGAYTPSYDAKQLAEFSVVGGQNFMPSLQGYKSEFGSSPFTDRRLSQDLLIGAQPFSIGEDYLVLCNNYGILFYEPDSGGFTYQYKSRTILDARYPWSVAYVGGDYYFCHKDFGVVRYRPYDNSWFELTENVPSSPMSVCSASGRLVILGESTYAWSAVGDGTNLATSLTTGAGFQALSLVGGGKPLGVKTIINGYMVYTTSGIIKVESINSANPFYHKVLTSSDFAPVSPKAIAEVGTGTHVFLTRTGLFATSGEYPEAFEPEFSKWLTGTLLRYLLSSRYELPVSLSYSTVNKWLMLSYSEYSIIPSPYSLAFVFDIELGKWGRFDQPHYFMGAGYLPTGDLKGYRLLTATFDSTIRVFDKDYGISNAVDINNPDNYPASCPNPIKIQSTTEVGSIATIFAASARLDTYDFASINKDNYGYYSSEIVYSTAINLDYPKIPDREQPAIGVDMMLVPDSNIDMMTAEPAAPSTRIDYRIDMMVGGVHNHPVAYCVFDGAANSQSLIKLTPQLDKLPSKLELGLYHIAEFDDINQATVVTGFCEIHDEWVGEDTVIDMELIADITLDMETIENEIVDMGVLSVSKPNFKTKLISSSDGYGNLDYHQYEIDPLTIVGNRYNYNAYSTGLYHGFEVETESAGDFYHLKQIQLNLIQGGLIYDRAAQVSGSANKSGS